MFVNAGTRAGKVIPNGIVLLEQQTAATSATLNFAASISSAFDEYMIELLNVVPATNAVNFLMRMSTNGGASYDSGTNYAYMAFVQNRFGSNATGADSGGSSIRFNYSAIDNTATKGLCGTMRLFNPASVTTHKHVLAQLIDISSGTPEIESAMGCYQVTTPVNACQFLFSSGNIASGTIRVYGIPR